MSARYQHAFQQVAASHVVVLLGVWLWVTFFSARPTPPVHTFQLVRLQANPEAPAANVASAPPRTAPPPIATPPPAPTPTRSTPPSPPTPATTAQARPANRPTTPPRTNTATARPNPTTTRPTREPTVSYREFQRQQGQTQSRRATVSPNRAQPNVQAPQIDTSRITRELRAIASQPVVLSNVEGTLVPAEATALQMYVSRFRAAANAAWQPPGNEERAWQARAVFTIEADGRVSGIRFEPGSGLAAFDESVRQALARTNLGPLPGGRALQFGFPFRLQE